MFLVNLIEFLMHLPFNIYPKRGISKLLSPQNGLYYTMTQKQPFHVLTLQHDICQKSQGKTKCVQEFHETGS